MTAAHEEFNNGVAPSGSESDDQDTQVRHAAGRNEHNAAGLSYYSHGLFNQRVSADLL